MTVKITNRWLHNLRKNKMLDKSKLYQVINRRLHQNKTFKILFEDNLSWYVEEINGRTDSRGSGIRCSLKKSCFSLGQVRPKFLVVAPELRQKVYEVEADIPAEAILNLHADLTQAINVGSKVRRRADLDHVEIKYGSMYINGKV